MELGKYIVSEKAIYDIEQIDRRWTNDRTSQALCSHSQTWPARSNLLVESFQWSFENRKFTFITICIQCSTGNQCNAYVVVIWQCLGNFMRWSAAWIAIFLISNYLFYILELMSLAGNWKYIVSDIHATELHILERLPLILRTLSVTYSGITVDLNLRRIHLC